MLLHAQIFKESYPVADWQPVTTYMTDEDLSSASSRLIVRAITSGVLAPKKDISEQGDPEKTGSTEAQSNCATFKKSDLSFHACQLLDKDSNPTNKNLYLVCVTAIDPKVHSKKENNKPSDEEGDPVEEAEEDAKLKFFDFSQALKAEMS